MATQPGAPSHWNGDQLLVACLRSAVGIYSDGQETWLNPYSLLELIGLQVHVWASHGVPAYMFGGYPSFVPTNGFEYILTGVPLDGGALFGGCLLAMLTSHIVSRHCRRAIQKTDPHAVAPFLSTEKVQRSIALRSRREVKEAISGRAVPGLKDLDLSRHYLQAPLLQIRSALCSTKLMTQTMIHVFASLDNNLLLGWCTHAVEHIVVPSTKELWL